MEKQKEESQNQIQQQQPSQTPLKGMSIEQLEKFWDSFSTVYDHISKAVCNVFYTMVNMVSIQDKKNVLDAGCGPGFQLSYLVMLKRKQCKYTAIDLSGNMLALAGARLEKLSKESNNPNFLLGESVEIVEEFPGKKVYEQFNITLQKANTEDLQGFESNSFDAYISNLCLHLTETPENMLRECFRVLQPGKPAIFSVWGRQEFSQVFILPGKILKEHGIEIPQGARTNFHLNDKQKLEKLLVDAGFVDIMMWYQFEPFNLLSEEQISQQLRTPTNYQYLKDKSPEEREKIEKSFVETYQNYQKNNKTALGIELLVVMGTKPK